MKVQNVCPLPLLLCLCLSTLWRVPSSRATDAYPTTNDQSTTIATGQWFFWGQTSAQIGAFCNKNNARITQIRIDDPSVPTFTVTMISNTGAYGSAWWWYYGVSVNDIGGYLNNTRLISLDPYVTSAGVRFAMVMVPNVGDQNRAWWWYVGIKVDDIESTLSEHNARLVSLRSYAYSGEQLFAIIMISNYGLDFKQWSWYTQISSDQILSNISTGYTGQRLTSFSPDPFGGWDVIFVESEGEQWWWDYDLDGTQVGQSINSHNSRLIDISTYAVNGNLKFAIVELDNSNLPQSPINAESTAVRTQAETGGWSGGYHGSYFVESSASPSPIVADNSYFRFEPASAIKVLYLLYTLQQLGVNLGGPITYYWPNSSNPTPTVCPYLDGFPEVPKNAQQTTILNALTQMMRNSNNIFTRAFALHWGLAPVQAMAESLGMTNTHLRQAYIGCLFTPGGVRNELTLEDAAKLYSSVDRSVSLSGAARDMFFQILITWSPSSAGEYFGPVVTQEAEALGKLSILPQFLAQMNVKWKDGYYTICMSSVCDVVKLDISIAGWMSLPFKVGDGVQNRSYLFGAIVNDLYCPCAASANNICTPVNDAGSEVYANAAEAARGAISQALETW
jgi:hypothetical protein